MGVENRRHPRWDLSLPVHYKMPSAKGFSFGKLLASHTRSSSVNISVGGLLLKAKEPVSHGVQLHLKIDFPASDCTVTANAEVLYCRKDNDAYQIGMRFLDFHTESEDLLGDILIQQLKQIKALPSEKQDEAKKRIYERLFMSMIQTEYNEKHKPK